MTSDLPGTDAQAGIELPVIERYQVTKLLGKGGMGVVVKASHAQLDKQVAIKVLHANLVDGASRQRFEIEAKAGSRLTHPNLVSIFDYGVTADGKPYMVMEFIEGQSLESFISQNDRMEIEMFLSVFEQIGKALQYIHRQNIVHRDIKSSNIMLQVIEGDLYAKLVDFGIAKVLAESGMAMQKLTETGSVFGSPLYMSPEQCRGLAVDQRSDIYSLGCVMYECIAGTPPIVGENVLKTIFMHVNDPPEPLPELNSPDPAVCSMARLIHRCLEKDPGARFADSGELLQALASIGEDLAARRYQTGETREQSSKQMLARWRRTDPRPGLSETGGHANSAQAGSGRVGIPQTGTAPSGTFSSGISSGSAPSGTQTGSAPSGTQTGSAPSGTQAGSAPSGTQAGSAPSGTQTGSAPSGTQAGSAPSGTQAGSAPSGTQAGSAPSGTQAGSAPSGTFSSGISSGSAPSGTQAGSAPSGTFSSGISSGSAPSGTQTGSAPSGTFSSGTTSPERGYSLEELASIKAPGAQDSSTARNNLRDITGPVGAPRKTPVIIAACAAGLLVAGGAVLAWPLISNQLQSLSQGQNLDQARSIYSKGEGHYGEAEKPFLAALAESKDNGSLSEIYECLGRIYLQKGDLAKARTQFDKVIALKTKPETNKWRLLALSGLSELEVRQNNFEAATKHLEQARDLAARIDAEPGMLGDLLSSSARLAARDGKNGQAALSYFDHAIAEYQKLPSGQEDKIARSWLESAELAARLTWTAEASNRAAKAIAIADSIKDDTVKSEILRGANPIAALIKSAPGTAQPAFSAPSQPVLPDAVSTASAASDQHLSGAELTKMKYQNDIAAEQLEQLKRAREFTNQVSKIQDENFKKTTSALKGYSQSAYPASSSSSSHSQPAATDGSSSIEALKDLSSSFIDKN
ncbi:MAG: protein kinase [Candidatus Melainabacteria bacterium]|nr:protein kinase [Candidatus Melainabacteria bacterium]